MRDMHHHHQMIPASVSIMSIEDNGEDEMEEITLGEESSPEMATSLDEMIITPPTSLRQERRQSNGLLERSSMGLLNSRDSVSAKGLMSGTTAQIPKIPHEGFTKAKGIEFDLNQPWQRSLLKELHLIEMGRAASRAEQKPDLVLLSHSESHDNAVEIDQDNASVGTNASSTVPTKPQIVHRSTQCKQQVVKGETRSAMMEGRDEIAYAETSPPAARRRREDVSSARPIPNQLPRNRRKSAPELPIYRAKHISEKHQPYLEMELSDSFQDNNMYADPACFCWGYNVLDFWLKPNTPQYQRRRLSSRKFSAAKLAEILEHAEESIDLSSKQSLVDPAVHGAHV